MIIPLLHVDNISSSYGPVKVLTDLSITVNEGELVALVGANGAGKTTLLRCISGVQAITSGQIKFNETNISKLRADQIVSAGISQSPEGRQVFAPLTVEDNLLLGSFSLKSTKQQQAEAIEEIYQLFPILKERKDQSAGTLSGGQQQMLAIGRALMAKPRLLILDEPSMGLAPLLVKEIFLTIKKLNKQGTTVLLVEQNAKMALSIADRGYVIETGKVMMTGEASELLGNEAIQRAYLGH
ncbi:MAG TPA: ABC transporter ATP-binding protein [Leucothrix sp.]|nr:ABC transporter ATP-binding protein [Leucothrix sp.]